MKSAFSRLVVAVLDLFTAVLTLAGALVRRLAVSIEPARTARVVAPASARPNLRVVPAPASKADQLSVGLRRLGFKAPRVDEFVAGADLSQSLQNLLKEGLAHLGRAA